MAQIPELNGFRGGFTPGQTAYYSIANGAGLNTSTEANVQRTVRDAGTYSNLYITIFANTVSASSTFRFRKNTANGNQSLSIGAGATGEFEDASNSDAVVAGDLVNLQLSVGAGGTSIRPSNTGCLFAATSNTSIRHGVGISFATASTTGYMKLEGASQTAPTTESASEQFKMKVDGTIKNLNIVIATNGRSSSTTYGSRVNGANGNLTLSVGAGATGQFEDTSNSDIVVSGDLVNRFVTTGTGTGTISGLAYSTFETTDGSTQLIGAFNAQSVNTSQTWYVPLMGLLSNAITTESEVQAKLNIACTLSQYECYVGTNGISATSTVRPRKAAGNINGAISITASTTGWFEDTSNSDTLVATDLVNWQIATGGTGTSLTLDYISCKLATASSPAMTLGTIAGIATASASLSARRAVNVTVAGVATASATLQAMRSLSASVAGTSTASVEIHAQRALVAAANGQASVTTELHARRALTALVAGVATVSVTVGRTGAMLVDAAGLATVAVLLSALRNLSLGVIAGIATVTAALGKLRHTSASVDGTSTVTVEIRARRAISVAVDGSSTVNITANARRAISVSVGGTSTVSATLEDDADATTRAAGKYKPEHDSAYSDIAAATGFSSEHRSAYRDLLDAGG